MARPAAFDPLITDRARWPHAARRLLPTKRSASTNRRIFDTLRRPRAARLSPRHAAFVVGPFGRFTLVAHVSERLTKSGVGEPMRRRVRDQRAACAALWRLLSAMARGGSLAPARIGSDTSCRVLCLPLRRESPRGDGRGAHEIVEEEFLPSSARSPPSAARATTGAGPPHAPLREKRVRSAAPEVPSIKRTPFRGRLARPGPNERTRSAWPTPLSVSPSLRGTDGASVKWGLGLPARGTNASLGAALDSEIEGRWPQRLS